MSRIYDCPPSLDEFGVIDFCKNGFLLFPGVVSEEINERTIEFIETNPGPVDYEPSHILDEDWFVKNVICQPEAAGAGALAWPAILMSSHLSMWSCMGRHRDGFLAMPILYAAGDHGRAEFSPQCVLTLASSTRASFGSSICSSGPEWTSYHPQSARTRSSPRSSASSTHCGRLCS